MELSYCDLNQSQYRVWTISTNERSPLCLAQTSGQPPPHCRPAWGPGSRSRRSPPWSHSGAARQQHLTVLGGNLILWTSWRFCSDKRLWDWDSCQSWYAANALAWDWAFNLAITIQYFVKINIFCRLGSLERHLHWKLYLPMFLNSIGVRHLSPRDWLVGFVRTFCPLK